MLFTIFVITVLNFSGGSMLGFPNEKSNTLSAPCIDFNFIPSSNIFLIQEDFSIIASTFFDMAIKLFLLLKPTAQLSILSDFGVGKKFFRPQLKQNFLLRKALI